MVAKPLKLWVLVPALPHPNGLMMVVLQVSVEGEDHFLRGVCQRCHYTYSTLNDTWGKYEKYQFLLKVKVAIDVAGDLFQDHAQASSSKIDIKSLI